MFVLGGVTGLVLANSETDLVMYTMYYMYTEHVYVHVHTLVLCMYIHMHVHVHMGYLQKGGYLQKEGISEKGVFSENVISCFLKKVQFERLFFGSNYPQNNSINKDEKTSKIRNF